MGSRARRPGHPCAGGSGVPLSRAEPALVWQPSSTLRDGGNPAERAEKGLGVEEVRGRGWTALLGPVRRSCLEVKGLAGGSQASDDVRTTTCND